MCAASAPESISDVDSVYQESRRSEDAFDELLKMMQFTPRPTLKLKLSSRRVHIRADCPHS